MEKIDKTNKELGKSRGGVHRAQFGKQGATDDTKWQISVSPTSRWANRFIIAAIVQGALAAGVTSYLLYDAVYGSPVPPELLQVEALEHGLQLAISVTSCSVPWQLL